MPLTITMLGAGAVFIAFVSLRVVGAFEEMRMPRHECRRRIDAFRPQDMRARRGLGVLNIRQMFGDTAVKKNKYLRLIVHLTRPHLEPQPSGMERLTGDLSARRVLDLDVPMITLPVMPGRNLAVLTEAATRTHILRAKGVDPAAAFMARHSHFLERGTP